jgi:hypothetical protein
MNARGGFGVVIGMVLGILGVLAGCNSSAPSGSPRSPDASGASATSAHSSTNDGASPLVLEPEASSAASQVEVKDEQDQGGDSDTNGQTGEFDGEHQDAPDDMGESDTNDGAGLLVLEAEGSSAALQAEVQYEQEANGTSFDVAIVGGPAGATVDVTFAGRVLAAATLDAHGVGRVELGSTPEDLSQEPLPADFPTLKAGDVLSIGDLSLTLVDGEED